MTLRDYSISIHWPDGQQYFDLETFDELSDAEDRRRFLVTRFDGTRGSGSRKKPRVIIWKRIPVLPTPGVKRAPSGVSFKSRTRSSE